MKSVIVLTLLLVSQLFAAEFKKQGGEYVYRDTLRFDEAVLDLKTLDVEAVNGRIEITGEERSSVNILAYVEIKAEDLEQGQKYLRDFKPVVKRDGDRLRVYGEYPESDWTWDEISANMDFVIVAPKQLDLDASCANGEIEASEMNGAANLESANGEITFISKEGVTGQIDASCANGEIDIDVASLSDNCEFSSANGEINVTVHNTLAGNIAASTANGEIVLALPENSSMKVTASSIINGSISSDWSGKHEENLIGDEFELVVNEGKYLVDCSSANGEIAIRKANRAN